MGLLRLAGARPVRTRQKMKGVRGASNALTCAAGLAACSKGAVSSARRATSSAELRPGSPPFSALSDTVRPRNVGNAGVRRYAASRLSKAASCTPAEVLTGIG